MALLLIVACANVSNLLLSRAAFRQREFAVRGALGSGTRRIIQQCLTESIVLGGIGGAGGLLLANAGVKLVSSLIPQGMLPRLDAVRIDPHVLVSAAAASLFSSVVFGLAPALQAVRTEFASALAGGTRTHTARSSHQQWLIGAEVALAFVLLAGAGLLFKSFERLTSVDPGFRPERVVAADVTLPEGPYPTLAEMRAFASAVLTRIHEQPDVIDAGAVNLLPIGGPMLSGDFLLDGVERPRGFIAVKPAVAPGYFRTIGVPLLQGRDFDDRDTYRTSGVAIVSEQFARRAWPGARPIGRRLKLGFGTPEQQPWLTVVGVVGDIKQRTLADATQPAIYVPLLQAPRPFLLRNLSFVARTRVDTARAASLIRRTIHAVDPDLPVGRIATMDQLIADSVSEPRFRTILLGGFAVSALVLIVIGLVGVLGYSVARRTREIGVRAALGARRTEIALLVVKQSMTITLFGVVAGAMLAYPLTRLLEAFLFDVSPHDLPTFVAIAVILSVTALAASYVPARRATRVDPLAALRCE